MATLQQRIYELEVYSQLNPGDAGYEAPGQIYLPVDKLGWAFPKRITLDTFIQASFYFNDGDPYTDTAEAYTVVGTYWFPYLTVNIAGVEYWFDEGGVLVEKFVASSIADGSITLAKMADVATATVFYRKTAGTGAPEVQTLATLKTDLGIDALETGKVDVVAGYGLISDAERALIGAAKQVVFTLTLPNAVSVAARVALMVETTDYPTGWTVEADTNPIDLKITHGLERRIVDATVYSVDGTAERKLYGNSAYSGIYAPTNEILIIESLATIGSDIVLHLIFS